WFVSLATHKSYYYTVPLTFLEMLILLSSQLSRHHRHLHSFPTRRSSDLELNRPAKPLPDERLLSRVWWSARKKDESQDETFDERSEEHTSELQSRVDLVCRLLLEKKKKRKNSNNKLIRACSQPTSSLHNT